MYLKKKRRGKLLGKCVVLAASNRQPAAGGIRTPWILRWLREEKNIRRDWGECEREIGHREQGEPPSPLNLKLGRTVNGSPYGTLHSVVGITPPGIFLFHINTGNVEVVVLNDIKDFLKEKESKGQDLRWPSGAHLGRTHSVTHDASNWTKLSLTSSPTISAQIGSKGKVSLRKGTTMDCCWNTVFFCFVFFSSSLLSRSYSPSLLYAAPVSSEVSPSISYHRERKTKQTSSFSFWGFWWAQLGSGVHLPWANHSHQGSDIFWLTLPEWHAHPPVGWEM